MYHELTRVCVFSKDRGTSKSSIRRVGMSFLSYEMIH